MTTAVAFAGFHGDTLEGRWHEPCVPVQLVGADHVLTDPDRIRFVGERLATWFDEQL